MSLDKLVRDKIPKIINEDGKTPKTHVAEEEELWSKLKDKLQEEVDEFIEDEAPQELADILEVILAICEYKNIGFSDIEKIRKEKKEKKGGFSKKIILEDIE